MSFAQAEAEIPKFSATQQERHRHAEMLSGKKVGEQELRIAAIAASLGNKPR